jgi:hypothetical protein
LQSSVFHPYSYLIQHFFSFRCFFIPMIKEILTLLSHQVFIVIFI